GLGTSMPRCVDCIAEGITTNRPTPHGGPRSPRCATHYRARKAAQKAARQAAHGERTYSRTEAQYQALLAAQGGECAGGVGAQGRSKRLAVDHDQQCCPAPVSCGQCVRGLLCTRCNRYLGTIHDNPDALRRLADYLENPPAKRVL